MKSNLLKTLIAVMLVVTCVFAFAACGVRLPKDDNTDDNDDTTIGETAFAKASWATIAEVSESGDAYTTYNLGDEKTVTLSTGETITFLILGFSHDDLADGTGRAGITIGMKDLMESKYQLTNVASSIKWSESLLRTQILPSIFYQFPAELKSVIKPVKKYTSLGGTNGTEMTEDTLFTLSLREIADNSSYPGGAQYAYWRRVKDGKLSEDRIKYLGGTGGDASDWVHRYIADNSISYVGSDGTVWSTSSNGMTALKGLNFAFCV